MPRGVLILSVASDQCVMPDDCGLREFTIGMPVSPRWPAWGSALKVPPPPDYSTPVKVTARAREGGTGDWTARFKVPGRPNFKRLLKAFRKVCPPMPCRVEDTHRPKWEYREIERRWERRQLGVTRAKWEPMEVET